MKKEEMDTQPTMQALWDMMTRRFDRIDTQQAGLRAEMDKRFNLVDARFEKTEEGLAEVKAGIDILIRDIHAVRVGLELHSKRLAKLEEAAK